MILNGSPRGSVNLSNILNQGRSSYKIKYVKFFFSCCARREGMNLSGDSPKLLVHLNLS